MHGATGVDPADIAALELAGRGAFPGFRLRTLALTPSTQDVVRAAARGGAEAGYCCLAGGQSAGRGRQGRRWSAPAGTALLCSILVRARRQHLGGVPIAAGLAVRAAVASTTGYQCLLKWPNDVLAGGRKLAGVLCEVEPAAPGEHEAVVVGIGVNIRVPSFPAGAVATSLHRLVDDPPAPARLLAPLLTELRARLDTLDSRGVAGLRAEWLEHAAGLGEQVTAHSLGRSVSGLAAGLDDDGALIIETDTGPVRVLAADVHIGPAPS